MYENDEWKRDKQSLEIFQEFLNQNFINYSDSIQIHKYENGQLGLISSKHFSQGEIVFEVPNKIIISADKCKNSALSNIKFFIINIMMFYYNF